jgi:CBS domain-containing protein
MLDDEKRHLIERYFDSQLDESGVADAMRLLEQSDEAQQYYNELKVLAEQAEGLMLDGDDDFWRAQKESILDRIAAEDEKKIVPVKAGNKFWRLRTLAVAASVILVGVITIYEVKRFPDFNRPKEDAMPRMAPAVVDTAITKVRDEDAVKKGPITPKAEPRAVEDEKASPPPEPSITTEQVMMAEVPAMTHEKGVEWQTPGIELQGEGKLDVAGSNLIQPSMHHEEITLEQGMEALDHGRVEEGTEQPVAVEPDSREGVGLKPRELAKPETAKRKISDMPVVSVDSLLKLNSSDYGYDQNGKIIIRGGRAGEVAFVKEKEALQGKADHVLLDKDVTVVGMTVEEVDSLAYWSRRLDSLEVALAETNSPHYRMAVAKATRRTTTADSATFDSLRWHYAEALYKAAMLSGDTVDIRPHIDKLSRLKEQSRGDLTEIISRYMSDLESRKK